jgi:Spy/CpxP family protein refolding chaperone
MIDLKVGLLALATVGAAGALGAGALRGHGGFHGHRSHAMMEKFIDFTLNQKLDEIQATEAQKQKVHEIKDRLVGEGKALHDDRDDFRKQIVALLAQDEPDAARIRALVQQRTEAFTRFAGEATDAVLELHGVLTPDQRKQLLAHVQEHMEAHGR